jgi:hypothetical protein
MKRLLDPAEDLCARKTIDAPIPLELRVEIHGTRAARVHVSFSIDRCNHAETNN